MRRREVNSFIAAVVALGVLALAPPARADVPVLHLDGRGFGHGVGLAQWGAKYAADAGATSQDILATFYPGTELGQAGGDVRVAVHNGPNAVLAFPQGGELRSPLVGDQQPGFPVAVGPGGSVVVAPDGSGGMRVDGVVAGQSVGSPQCLPLLGPCPGDGGNGDGCALGCGPTTAPPPADPPATAPPETEPPAAPPPTEPPAESVPPGTEPPATGVTSPGSVWAVPAGGAVTDVTARGRSYRGVVEAVPADGGLRLVNQLDVETYLKGMAEVPATWPAAAQEAQAVAARTYVLRAMNASGEVCDYDRCQVYVGATREAAGQNAAVDATRGTVLNYGGALAASVYSADAGGITATPGEGFGSGGGSYPYLTNVRYDTPDPLPWVLDVGLGDLASRFGYPGNVSDVRIAEAGPSGRALQVALVGDAGERIVDGHAFARGLGLRSTLFTASLGTASSVAALPPAAPLEEQMALPDDVGALTAAVGGTGSSLGASSNPLGVVSDLQVSLRPPRPMEDHPATYIAAALLAATTALGMARFGGGEALAAFAGTVTLPSLPMRRRRPPPPDGEGLDH